MFRYTPRAGIKLLALYFAEILHFICLSILLLSQILRLRLFLCFHYVIEKKKLPSHLSPGLGNISCRHFLWAHKTTVCLRQLCQAADWYVTGKRRQPYRIFLFSIYRYHLPQCKWEERCAEGCVWEIQDLQGSVCASSGLGTKIDLGWKKRWSKKKNRTMTESSSYSQELHKQKFWHELVYLYRREVKSCEFYQDGCMVVFLTCNIFCNSILAHPLPSGLHPLCTTLALQYIDINKWMYFITLKRLWYIFISFIYFHDHLSALE